MRRSAEERPAHGATDRGVTKDAAQQIAVATQAAQGTVVAVAGPAALEELRQAGIAALPARADDLLLDGDDDGVLDGRARQVRQQLLEQPLQLLAGVLEAVDQPVGDDVAHGLGAIEPDVGDFVGGLPSFLDLDLGGIAQQGVALGDGVGQCGGRTLITGCGGGLQPANVRLQLADFGLQRVVAVDGVGQRIVVVGLVILQLAHHLAQLVHALAQRFLPGACLGRVLQQRGVGLGRRQHRFAFLGGLGGERGLGGLQAHRFGFGEAVEVHQLAQAVGELGRLAGRFLGLLGGFVQAIGGFGGGWGGGVETIDQLLLSLDQIGFGSLQALDSFLQRPDVRGLATRTGIGGRRLLLQRLQFLARRSQLIPNRLNPIVELFDRAHIECENLAKPLRELRSLGRGIGQPAGDVLKDRGQDRPDRVGKLSGAVHEVRPGTAQRVGLALHGTGKLVVSDAFQVLGDLLGVVAHPGGHTLEGKSHILAFGAGANAELFQSLELTGGGIRHGLNKLIELLAHRRGGVAVTDQRTFAGLNPQGGQLDEAIDHLAELKRRGGSQLA